jgi:hypothetical protein
MAAAEVMVSDAHTGRAPAITVVDGFAAAMHDEFAWELNNLGHGALTFSMRYPGNDHVDMDALARAVNENHQSYLRFALQAFVPNPVTYLTEGDQHSIDAINGHRVEVKGGGSVELGSRASVEELLEGLEWARTAPLGTQKGL